jgi:RNHCP domain
MSKKFQRRIENFKCENCGYDVVGNGYTNHCPKCLWSKHVDINPGDRENSCHGLMKPISYSISGGRYVLIQQCERCGAEKNIKLRTEDSVDTLIRISNSRKNKL